MEHGNGETLLVLNRQSELKAVEAGLAAAALTQDPAFSMEVHDAAFTRDYDRRPMGTVVIHKEVRRTHPNYQVTENNVAKILLALHATRKLGGLEGLKATLMLRKATATRVINQLRLVRTALLSD